MDRKALIKKHETIISTLTKDIKKKKGAYKTAAEQKLAEAQAAYDAELAAFDAGAENLVVHTGGGEEQPPAESTSKPDGDKAETKDTPASKGAQAKVAPNKEGAKTAAKAKETKAEEQKPATDKKVKLDWDKKDLNGMSKKDLEEECAKLSLGKKGSKEDLVTRLMTFALDNDRKEEESDEEEEEDDATANMTEEEKKEAERLYKREQALYKALRVLLKKKPEGVLVSTVLEELGALGVKNFKPQLLNFDSMEALFEDIPEYVLDYQAGPPAKIFPSGSLLDI